MKLTRRQLYKLINESLNINEARVPRPRRLIKNIDDASSRVDTLIKRLSAGEGRYTKAELEADREELNKYLDNLKIALDREFGIKPRQRRKVAPVKNKIEDFLAGETVEPTSGTETAAQTPSDKGKKTRKTRAERKANRKAKGAEVAMGIVHMIGELKKKLKDETNKRRKQALKKTIDFLEKRQKALKKGAGAPETAPPPFVLDTIELNFEKPATVDFLKNSLIKAPFELSDDDVEELDMISQQEANTSEREDEEPPTSDTETDPNKGTENLAQTPEPPASSWSSNRGTTRLRASGNITSSAASSSEIKGVGDVLAGKGKHDDKTLPGLPTFYVSTVEEWGTGSGIRKDAWKEQLYKFEEIPTSSAVEKFNDMGNETVAPGGKGLGSNMKNNFIYDDKEETLYYDSAGFTNYKVRNVELTPDGKHLRIKGLTNESRSYGKSHATLLRERYWGRY